MSRVNTLTILIVAGSASTATLAAVVLPVLHSAWAASGSRFTAVSYPNGLVNIQDTTNPTSPTISLSAAADAALKHVPGGTIIGGSLATDEGIPTYKFSIANGSTGILAIVTVDGINGSVLRVIQTSNPISGADAIGIEQGSNSTNSDEPGRTEPNAGAPL